MGDSKPLLIAVTVLLIAGGLTVVLYFSITATKDNNSEPVVEQNICELPRDEGPCEGAFPRWYFDIRSEACTQFTYGGCDGNFNNFLSEDDCESQCGDRGGLPETCVQLQDTPFATNDVSGIFGTTDFLEDVCPPKRTGNLRDKAALPTHNFGCNQLNIDPSPIRQFPHLAVLDESGGVTYEGHTLDRWSDPLRTDEFYQLTPGKDGTPWDKIGEIGAGMKQMDTAPDGNPLAGFSGDSGIRVAIEDGGDAELTDFGEMYANFLYTDTNGGTMELPFVRGSGMLTHLFTNAKPVLTPRCLTSINGIETTSDCPEERSQADEGTVFFDFSCDNDTGIMNLVLHSTKPIANVKDIQWAAAEEQWWASNNSMHTCDTSSCSLSEDGLTATVEITDAYNIMNFAVNVIDHFVIPQSDYTYWYIPNPFRFQCTSPAVSGISYSGRMPVWFYESASTTRAQCIGNSTTGMVDVMVTLTSPARYLAEIDYMLINEDSWTADHDWIPCTEYFCELTDGGKNVVFTLPATSAVMYFAANIHGQFTLQVTPHNWRRQPTEIRCSDAPAVETPQAVSLNGKKFIFEMKEPAGSSLTNTRKFVTFFSEEMRMTYNEDGAKFLPVSGGDTFSGIMQLTFAGSGAKGDFATADSLADFAGVYSYKPKTRFCTEGNRGYISFDWNKQGGDFYGENAAENLLTMMLPHHDEMLDEAYVVDTPWGFKGYIGDRWILEEDLPVATLEPDMDAVNRIKNDEVKLNHILDAIQKDADFQILTEECVREGAQSYWAGKSIQMVARLATISRAFGTDHYQKLDEDLRTCLDLWLGITQGLPEENVFRYETSWGGMNLLSEPPGNEVFPWSNFGFVSYADHHFHLAYWMYAIAYYATYHQDWAMEQDHYDRILALARDVGNPSSADTFFPTVRHKDFYFGSSWATGIGGGSRQEESTSEAINCYHALAALGEALNHQVMQNVGQLMLATEIRATRWYWTVRENNKHIFPEPLRKYGVLGQLQENGIFYYTLNWECEPDQFPQRHACIVGIQLIPIMSISHHYVDQEWAEKVYDICSWAIDPTSAPGGTMIDQTWDSSEPVTTRWGAFCQTIMAKKDAASQAAAVNYTLGLDTSDLEPGSGLASNLLFIYEST